MQLLFALQFLLLLMNAQNRATNLQDGGGEKKPHGK